MLDGADYSFACILPLLLKSSGLKLEIVSAGHSDFNNLQKFQIKLRIHSDDHLPKPQSLASIIIKNPSIMNKTSL